MYIHRIMEMAPRQIALDKVDKSPGPFCMSFGFTLDPLIRSIREVGVINPPILKSDPEGLTIVCGYRRIMALKKLKVETAAFRVIFEHDGILPLECLLLNLHDNLATRNLNDVEKGMVLSRLDAWVSREEIVQRYMPLLGLRSHEKNLRFFLEMERDFGAKIKMFVAEGRLSWQAVKMVSEMDAPSRSAILKLISELKLNINQQSQFIEYLVDLSFIKDRSIPQILEAEAFTAICSDAQPNRPQQAKAMLSKLRTRRNPSIVSAEMQFNRMVSDLNLPDGIRISAPPFFEGENYKLEVFFKEGQDLKTKIEGLKRIRGLAELGHPWKGSPK
ncbi:MAG: hypothetical protein R6X27_02950 [Candidatus Desulfacyla sp.]